MKTLLERLAYKFFHKDSPADIERRTQRIQAAHVCAERLQETQLPFQLHTILLYGSVATGEDGPKSDIDIAVVIDCQQCQFQGLTAQHINDKLWTCTREVTKELFGTDVPVSPFNLTIISKQAYDEWKDISAVINTLHARSIVIK